MNYDTHVGNDLRGGGGGGGGGNGYFFVKLDFEIAVDQQTKTRPVTELLRGSRTPTAKRCPRGSHAHIWSKLGRI